MAKAKKYKWLSQGKVIVYNAFTLSPIKINNKIQQINNETIIEFGSQPAFGFGK